MWFKVAIIITSKYICFSYNLNSPCVPSFSYVLVRNLEVRIVLVAVLNKSVSKNLRSLSTSKPIIRSKVTIKTLHVSYFFEVAVSNRYRNLNNLFLDNSFVPYFRIHRYRSTWITWIWPIRIFWCWWYILILNNYINFNNCICSIFISYLYCCETYSSLANIWFIDNFNITNFFSKRWSYFFKVLILSRLYIYICYYIFNIWLWNNWSIFSNIFCCYCSFPCKCSCQRSIPFREFPSFIFKIIFNFWFARRNFNNFFRIYPECLSLLFPWLKFCFICLINYNFYIIVWNSWFVFSIFLFDYITNYIVLNWNFLSFTIWISYFNSCFLIFSWCFSVRFFSFNKFNFSS